MSKVDDFESRVDLALRVAHKDRYVHRVLEVFDADPALVHDRYVDAYGPISHPDGVINRSFIRPYIERDWDESGRKGALFPEIGAVVLKAARDAEQSFKSLLTDHPTESPRLYIATVEHALVPGTRTVAFFQVSMPTIEDVLNRFKVSDELRDEEIEQLEVTGVFDLTHAADHDHLTQFALEDFARSVPPIDGPQEAIRVVRTPSLRM